MEALATKGSPEEIQAIYLDASEVLDGVRQENNALDNLDPMLDALKEQLEFNAIKKARIRNKINTIMAKL